MIHGTFSYDAKSGKIIFKNSKGGHIGVMNLTLPGDTETEISGHSPHCQHVQLWLDAEGDSETPVIATADIARKPFALGEAIARALCAPAYLPRKLRDLQAKHAQNKGQHHAADNGCANPDYQFPPRRTLIEALACHSRHCGVDILIGWSYIAAFILTVLWLKNALWLGLILLYPLWVCIGAALATIFLKYRSSRQQKVIIRHWHNGQFQKALKTHIEKPEKP